MTPIYYLGGFMAMSYAELQEKQEKREKASAKYFDRDGRVRYQHPELGYIAQATFSGFPSQCGIMIVHRLENITEEEEGKKGLMEVLKRIEIIARDCGYSTLMATMPVNADNYSVLKTYGFRTISTFYNKRSTNTNDVLFKEVNENIK